MQCSLFGEHSATPSIYANFLSQKLYTFSDKAKLFYAVRQLLYGIEQAGLQDGFLDFSGRGVHDPEMGLAGAVFPLLFDIQTPVTQRHDFLNLPQAELTGRDCSPQVALR